MKLEQCQYLLDPDGGNFREIHIPNQSPADCLAIAKYLLETYSDLHFLSNSEVTLPPVEELVSVAAQKEGSLYFSHRGVGIHCYFTEPANIEFSFDVTEINSQCRLNILSQIIIGLAEQAGRDVLITPENIPDGVEGRFDFASKRYEIIQNA